MELHRHFGFGEKDAKSIGWVIYIMDLMLRPVSWFSDISNPSVAQSRGVVGADVSKMQLPLQTQL